MFKYVFAIVMLIGTAAQSRAEGLDDRLELKLGPALGYSSYSGLVGGGDFSLSVPLSERWQWKFGFDTLLRSKRANENSLSVYTGAVYNLGDDRSRAFFLGGGIVYGDRENEIRPDVDRDPRFYGYAEFGKRFRLNDSGTWTWAPTIYMTSGGVSESPVLTFWPLTFTYSF